MPTCKRNGCGKTFEYNDNKDQCSYHPQDPIFHEGLKGWACCAKRVISFDEFLTIPGCAVGSHSDLTNDLGDQSPISSMSSRREYNSAFTTATLPITATVPEQACVAASSVLQSGSNDIRKSSQATVADSIEEDPLDIDISPGTKCKRCGCNYIFVSKSLSCNGGAESICTFHSGTPVFHEASKGWSCCRRKVLEFEEFLKIRGCQTGNHLFVGSVDKNGEQVIKPKDGLLAEIRHDWYQSPSQVILTIYVKGLDRQNIKVEFGERRLLVEFPVPGTSDRVYQMNKELFQPIQPESSSFNLYRTKIELVMHKANGISWAALEATDHVTSWTTFGINGKTGTIGGKQMFLSNDSPILSSLNR